MVWMKADEARLLTGTTMKDFLGYFSQEGKQTQVFHDGYVYVQRDDVDEIFQNSFGISMDRCVSLSEAADEIGIQRDKLYYLIRHKKYEDLKVYTFPGNGINRKRYYLDRAEMDEWRVLVHPLHGTIHKLIEEFGVDAFKEAANEWA